jgi:hypothetical protein
MAVNTVSGAPHAEVATTAEPRQTSARTFLLLVAIILGAVGNLVNILFGYNGDDITVSWLASHQYAWAAALYGTAFNALGLIALLAAVCMLARRRGATWATVSLAVGSVGAMLYAASAAIPVAFPSFGTQNVISSTDATALLNYLGAHDMTQAAAAFPAFLLLVVTQITVTVALIRSRAVPLWVPIAFILGGVVETVWAASGALTAALTIPQIVAMLAIGWYAWKKSTV